MKEGVVLEALFQIARRGMRNLSTVAGLRAATEYNLEVLRNGERTDADTASEEARYGSDRLALESGQACSSHGNSW